MTYEELTIKVKEKLGICRQGGSFEITEWLVKTIIDEYEKEKSEEAWRHELRMTGHLKMDEKGL